MHSETIKKGVKRMPNRSLLYATGLSKEDMNKPFIGIASSFTDLVPGHVGMRDLERFIERGISYGGGVPFVFGIPAICDGIAMGHSGMNYSLPSRELIADVVESITGAHCLDGLVLLTNCDKITPGCLIAAARLNIPSIVVTAGPMLCGNYRGRRLDLVKDTFEAVGRFQSGKIGLKELQGLEISACPGQGSCQGLYTANTMACLTEVMGMSLSGCATALAVSAKKKRIAFQSGKMITELIKKKINPRKIMTQNALHNAVCADMALGGSTNTVLHLTRLADELGIDLPLKFFDRMSRSTSHIVNLRPAGEHFLEDLEAAGGIPAVLNVLKGSIKPSPTVNKGRSIKDIAAEGEIIDSSVIRPRSKPYHKEGGIAILFGNLAPQGSVVKQIAVDAKMRRFCGRARIFNSEEAAMNALMQKKIKKGSVIVIRYEGDKGAPGMPEMLSVTALVVGMGMQNDVALITDGRFSGGTRGPCIGHIFPEAAKGGPIAILKDGDTITIDIPGRRLDVKLSDEEIKRRLSAWKPPVPKIKTGYLAKYAKLL